MPDLMRISVFKNWLTTSTMGWVNTYEFSGANTFGPMDGTWLQVVDSIVMAEQILHLTSVVFNRAVIATWTEDGTPYNPYSFVTVPLSGSGSRVPGTSDPLDLNAVYNVRKAVGSGRNGKLAYRGVLIESDVDATLSGSWVLSPGGPLQELGTVFGPYESRMGDTMSGGILDVDMSLISVIPPATATVVRSVIDLVPAGVTFNKRNHRYFDVAP